MGYAGYWTFSILFTITKSSVIYLKSEKERQLDCLPSGARGGGIKCAVELDLGKSWSESRLLATDMFGFCIAPSLFVGTMGFLPETVLLRSVWREFLRLNPLRPNRLPLFLIGSSSGSSDCSPCA